MKSIIRTFLTSLILFAAASDIYSQTINELQNGIVDMRFGAFFHYGIRTYTGGAWGEANQDITKFDPTDLDCGQWADAMAAAKMKFGILTTKHHDGFCLWDSRYTDYDVASIPWRDGKGDVLREYVDALRKRNLVPCLYYSVWDNTAGIGNGPITEEDMKVIKGQITELLSNYGEIKLLFLDGWSWKMGHKEVPYDEIRALVKTLQPGCVMIDNTHLHCLYNNDIIHFEDGSACPPDNTVPAILSRLIYKNSGNSWFWDDRVPDAPLMSVLEIVDSCLSYLEPRWCSFILNLPPNPEGKIDDRIVSRLQKVGEAWTPDPNRKPIPEQNPFINKPITPFAATASTGQAYFAVDGKNDRYEYSVWESAVFLPQTLTVDLGEVHSGINILAYVPKYEPVIVPLTEGSVMKYKVYSSSDMMDFYEVARGEWSGDTKMKETTFEPVKARYIRLEIETANGPFAAATEISVGKTN